MQPAPTVSPLDAARARVDISTGSLPYDNPLFQEASESSPAPQTASESPSAPTPAPSNIPAVLRHFVRSNKAIQPRYDPSAYSKYAKGLPKSVCCRCCDFPTVGRHPQEPTTLQDAFSGPEEPIWREAIKEEFCSLIGMCTWAYAQLLPGRTALPCRWVFKRKRNAEGVTIDRGAKQT